MAQDQPKPFLVRLLLFIIGGYCGFAIVTVAIFLPFLLVANWGGGQSRFPGLGELLLGMGVAAAGFGLPMILLSKEARVAKVLLPVVVIVGAALIWPFVTQNGDPWFTTVLIGLAVLHGLAMFWAFGRLSGPAAPPEWKDMP